MFQQVKKIINLKKVWHFVRYHNAFTIGLAVCLVLAGAVFASDDIRNAVIGEKVVEQEGIDNTALLAADLDNLISEVRIKTVTEDQQYYYLTYYFPSMKIIDNVWQKAASTQVLKVSKEALGSKDLGLYAVEEIGEVVDKELAYLKEVKAIEEQKGITLVKETTTYTALIGLVLNPSAKELPGYQPVVKPEEPEPFVAIAGRDEAGERRAAREKLAQSAEVELPQEVQLPSIESTGAPETVLVSAPSALTTSTEALFSFGSTQDNSAFQCKVNQLDWYSCDSPKSYPGLVPGDYTFQVYAVAENGSYDSTPAEFSWTIEEISPISPISPINPISPTATSTQEQATTTPNQSSTSSDGTGQAEPAPAGHSEPSGEESPAQSTTTDQITPEPEPATTTTRPISPIIPISSTATTTQETATSTAP